MNIDQAIHERWARMTDDGTADSRVADLERACDDFFNRQHERYNLTPEAREIFMLFRGQAIADLKRQIVIHHSGPSARFADSMSPEH